MALHVQDHELVADPGDLIEVAKVTSGREDAQIIVPVLGVVHYAVTHSLDATVRAQQARGYWAHLSIDGFKVETEHGVRSAMKVVQQVPFNRRASHAGSSTWNGRQACNSFSIGIEIANPGPLEVKDGELVTTYGKRWPRAEAIETGPVPGYPSAWTHWASYTDEEVSLLATIFLALKERYALEAIVGHSDIAPGRKFDPGPAFPMSWLQSLVFPSAP